MRRFAALVLAASPWLAHGQPLAPAPRVPAVAFAPRPGTPVPPGLAFRDAEGRALRFGDELDGRPVLLALGYHRCPQLCGLALQGALDALHESGLPPAAARILFVSIDPRETPADASRRRARELAYARFLDPARPPALETLVGDASAIGALARAVGFDYRPVDDPGAPFAHPAGLLVLTPDGRVSSLLPGVRPGGAQLRAALAQAADGRLGPPADRLALLCAHVDPRLGAHTPAVLAGVRLLAALALLGLGALALRRRSA